MDGQIFAVQQHGGISRMFVELADQFIHDPDLGVSLEPLSMVTRNHYLLSESHLAEHLRVRPARWQHLTLARYLARPHRAMHADVVHSTFYLTRALRDFPGRPHVVTVHDMIPELFPESRRRADRITDKRRYVDQAAHVICVSESTKADLLRVFGDVQAPISVIPHGVNPHFVNTEARVPGFPQDYLLYVGKRGGYKDAATLINAMPHLVDEYPELTLMLVGGGALTSGERDRIARLGLSDRVMQRSVADIDMPAAYSAARASSPLTVRRFFPVLRRWRAARRWCSRALRLCARWAAMQRLLRPGSSVTLVVLLTLLATRPQRTTCLGEGAPVPRSLVGRSPQRRQCRCIASW